MSVSSPPLASSGYSYDVRFLNYSQRVSAVSAKRVTAYVAELFSIQSVLDVGCAQGTWLNHWQQLGVEDFIGVDGDYVIRERLDIPADHFVAQDVSESFNLDRTFDLVQCLEVAEHIPADHASTLVDNLTRHGDCILFSAAPPGQGGEYHVNEQPFDYWRELFQSRGYTAVDAVRPAIRGDSNVAIWYRYNIILYVRQDELPCLSKQLQGSVVPATAPIPDISAIPYRLRKLIVRRIPSPLQLLLAKLVARMRR